MKRLLFTIIIVVSFLLLGGCQEQKKTLYDPTADGVQQLESACAQARDEGKTVLVQVGGDWCKWCLRLNSKILNSQSLKKTMDSAYVWVHLYYGRDNVNADAMAKLGNPHDLGFPVLVVVNGEGRVLRIQETGCFERGEDYNEASLSDFLNTDWRTVSPIPLVNMDSVNYPLGGMQDGLPIEDDLEGSEGEGEENSATETEK